MQIQVNIPDDLNKKLKIYRIENDLKNLQEAVIDVTDKYFKLKNKKE